jgi:hypothetical protein
MIEGTEQSLNGAIAPQGIFSVTSSFSVTSVAAQTGEAKVKPERTMMDAQGQAVPLRYVNRYDRQRDRLVRQIAEDWMRERCRIRDLYEATEARLRLLEDLAAEGRTDRKLGRRGNFQASTFDGLIQASRSARYELRFDDRLRVAQEIIEEIIQEKAEGIDEDLSALIKGVFRPTSDGLLSQARVMGLFRLKIKHPRWQEAMDLIRDSIESRRGKNLLGVRVKHNRDSDWESILLDIAAVAPVALDAAANADTEGAKGGVQHVAKQ